MAEEVPTCKQCLNPFDGEERQPKRLECGHNLCPDCIDSQYSSYEKIICPQCKKKTKSRPSKLITDVPALLRSMEMMASIQSVLSIPEVNTDTDESSEEEGDDCKIHGESKTLYCLDDSKLICEKCTKDPAHEGHLIEDLDTAVDMVSQANFKHAEDRLSAIKLQAEKKIYLYQTEEIRIQRMSYDLLQKIQDDSGKLFRQIAAKAKQQRKLLQEKTEKIIRELQSKRRTFEDLKKKAEMSQEINIKESHGFLKLIAKANEIKDTSLTKDKELIYSIQVKQITNLEEQVQKLFKIKIQKHEPKALYTTVKALSNHIVSWDLENIQQEQDYLVDNIDTGSFVSMLGDVLITGGFRENWGNRIVHPQTGQEAQMLDKRYLHEVETDNFRAFIVGGYYGQWLNQCEVYSQQKTQALPPAPIKFCQMGTALQNSVIHTFGGNTNAGDSDKIFSFDEKWIEMESILPSQARCTKGAALDNAYLIFSTAKDLQNTFIYDIAGITSQCEDFPCDDYYQHYTCKRYGSKVFNMHPQDYTLWSYDLNKPAWTQL